MTDILTKLAALAQKDQHGLLPCICGSTEITKWHGKGTQAEMYCARCSYSASIQVCDLFAQPDDFDFDMKTLRYPSEAVTRANAELVRRWNDRPRETALIALVQEAGGRLSGCVMALLRHSDASMRRMLKGCTTKLPRLMIQSPAAYRG